MEFGNGDSVFVASPLLTVSSRCCFFLVLAVAVVLVFAVPFLFRESFLPGEDVTTNNLRAWIIAFNSCWKFVRMVLGPGFVEVVAEFELLVLVFLLLLTVLLVVRVTFAMIDYLGGTVFGGGFVGFICD